MNIIDNDSSMKTMVEIKKVNTDYTLDEFKLRYNFNPLDEINVFEELFLSIEWKNKSNFFEIRVFMVDLLSAYARSYKSAFDLRQVWHFSKNANTELEPDYALITDGVLHLTINSDNVDLAFDFTKLIFSSKFLIKVLREETKINHHFLIAGV